MVLGWFSTIEVPRVRERTHGDELSVFKTHEHRRQR